MLGMLGMERQTMGDRSRSIENIQRELKSKAKLNIQARKIKDKLIDCLTN